MAIYLGRPLLPDEQVHHRIGDRLDNRLGNLELWSTSHPSGARIADLIEFAFKILIQYAASGGSRRLIEPSQTVPSQGDDEAKTCVTQGFCSPEGI